MTNHTATQARRTWLSQLRRGDCAVAAVLLVVIVGTSPPLLRRAIPGAYAVVHLPDGHQERLPLAVPSQHAFRGVRGETFVRIDGQEVQVTDSACPNKLCVQMGPIHRTGEIIVCVPNQVWITIEAAEEDAAVDGISR